jgi:predicted acyltransferase
MHDHGSERLVSLDAFRGFTIAAMILVNNPGDWAHLHAPLAHADWNGWTFTDMIFPAFLFICGVSMAYSVGRRLREGDHRKAMFWSLERRAFVIFFLGLGLNLVPEFNFATVRIPGVLQRIGLCIALAAPLVLWLHHRTLWGWIVALLVLYAFLMLQIPVPDYQGNVGMGVLEPGRDTGSFIDRTLLQGHLWVKSKTWDPEGLLSTIPALCSLLLGVQAGRRIALGLATPVSMAIMGALFVGLGLLLDAYLMPINKNLWSPSYVLFMNGCSLIGFAAFHFVLDASRSMALRDVGRMLLLPFTIYGMNALAIFVFSGLIARLLTAIKVSQAAGDAVTLKGAIYAPIASGLSPVNASLAYAVLFNLAMFAVAWMMWRRRWFIKA